ncbi:MAG: hypothetical protein R3E86_10005 [Pseudomonadales bacterium]
MHWDRYKALCDTPSVCSRHLLETTLRLCSGRLARAPLADLRGALAAPPLAKPADHRGGPETDMFATRFDAATVAAVLDVLQTPGDSGYVPGLVAAWHEYAAYLRPAGGPRGP